MDFDGWKRRSDQASLSALLETVEPRVERICRRILRDAHDAEEAKQEVLLEIASGLDSISDGGHFDRWVGRVAFRTALDRLRMRRRRVAREHAAAGRAPNGATRDDELHEAMSRLDDEDRDLLIERYFDRRTLREIGRRHDISAVGVRKRIAGAQDRLKKMLGVFGVVFMKTKTAAAAAVVLIPLLGLGVGVGVATARRNSKPVAEAPQPKSNAKVEAWLAESKGRLTPTSEPSEAVADQKSHLDRAQVRARIVATLERRRYVGRRAAECKELWPEASTEEEGRALQREKVALDKEWGELGVKLRELAEQDPANIVEMVKTARDLPERLALMGLIAPDVNSEIASEVAPSGPLLSGLLELAHGDTEEKAYFAAFAGQLTRANRELGQALMALMGDSDFHVRKHAGQALWALADGGALKEFLKDQIPALKQAALRQGGELDYLCVGSPLKILASLGTDDADDFVLHQFETMESTSDLETITAALIAAPRIAGRHEARLNMAILRALELRGHHTNYGLLRVAEHLPPEQRANIAKVSELNAPHPSPDPLPRLVVVRSRERPVRRSMTGVSRWEHHSHSSPGIHQMK